MQGYADLTSPKTRASNTGTPPGTVHYYVGRDRLLDDGKWLRGEPIAGPFADPFDATEALAVCGDESARVIKATTFGRVSEAAWAATYTQKSFHGFEFDMADGTTRFFNAQEVLQAPWYGTLPADDREHIEHWAAHFARKGWEVSHGE